MDKNQQQEAAPTDVTPTPEQEPAGITPEAGVEQLLASTEFLADLAEDAANEGDEPLPKDDEDPDGDKPVEDDGDEGNQDESDDPDPDEVQMYEVMVNGEPVEVSLEEMGKGYSRETDYTRKTQAHADNVRAFNESKETELAETRTARRKYADGLATIEKAMGPEPTDPNWDEIRQQDPAGYPKKFADHTLMKQRREALTAERQRTAQAEIEDAADQRQKFMAAETVKLKEIFPDAHKDTDTLSAFNEQLLAYGEVSGFTREEVGSYIDSRAVTILEKARLWDASQKKTGKAKEDLQEKVRKLPTLKPGARRNRSRRKGPTKEGVAARKRLETSGHARDAVSALEHLVED